MKLPTRPQTGKNWQTCSEIFMEYVIENCDQNDWFCQGHISHKTVGDKAHFGKFYMFD